jgi:hypothetical protein
VDRELERHLARIEGKVNIVAKSVSYISAVACGLGAFLLARSSEWGDWAALIGVGAGIFFGGIVDWRIRRLEKMLPYDDTI